MPADAPARVRLLVVDDELYNRDLMIRTFARDCEVIAAASVPDALEVLARATVDLVITDQALVGACGTELAQEVRDRWPATRVVVVTGFDDDALLTAALKSGIVDAVVPKPWTPAILRGRVMSLIKR